MPFLRWSAAIAVLAAIAASAAHAGPECPAALSGCVTVLGPWTQVYGAQDFAGENGGSYNLPPAECSVGYTVGCPNGQPVPNLGWSPSWLLCGGSLAVVGASANPGNDDPPPLWMFQLGLFPGGASPFQTSSGPFVNLGVLMFASFVGAPTAGPYVWQEVLGCLPTTSSHSLEMATALVAPRHATIHRVKNSLIHPSRVATELHRCRAGERLINPRVSLQWYTKKPPSVREMRELSEKHWVTHNTLYARVSSGPHVGDNETVKVQLHADCVR